jgi:6-phosphofructokinase
MSAWATCTVPAVPVMMQEGTGSHHGRILLSEVESNPRWQECPTPGTLQSIASGTHNTYMHHNSCTVPRQFLGFFARKQLLPSAVHPPEETLSVQPSGPVATWTVLETAHHDKPELPDIAQGHNSGATTVKGHNSVVTTIQGHDSVAATIQGHNSVAATIQGHNSVAATIQGHNSVAATIQGHNSVAATIQGHNSVAATIQGHNSVATPIQGLPASQAEWTFLPGSLRPQ